MDASVKKVLNRVLAAQTNEESDLNKEELKEDVGARTPVTQYFYFY